VSHVNVHKGSSRKEVVCFGRNEGDFVIAHFANITSACDSCNTVSNDDYVHKAVFSPCNLRKIKVFINIRNNKFEVVKVREVVIGRCRWKDFWGNNKMLVEGLWWEDSDWRFVWFGKFDNFGSFRGESCQIAIPILLELVRS